MALAGAYDPNLKLFDVILANSVFSESNFALTLNNDVCHFINANGELNKIIENTAKNLNISITKCNILCSEVFDKYMTDINKMLSRIPKEYDIAGAEMESFALFYNANLLNKKAACLATVVDTYYSDEQATAEDRQNSLNQMIKIGLESCLSL